MNYGEMQDQVRVLLGETDTGNTTYEVTEIADQLNRSQLRVASDIPTLINFAETDCIVGTYRYGLPTNFLQLKDVQLYISATNRRQLKRVSYDDYEGIVGGNVDMTGQPAFYRVEFGAVNVTVGSPPGDIWLYPSPDSTYPLRVVYYRKPGDMSADADVSMLPEYMHEAIAYHAAWHMVEHAGGDVQGLAV